MSNVVDLLERMGQDARLRHASQDEVELALAGAQIDPELRAAILAKDQRQLEVLLGQGTLCAFMVPAKEDEGDGEGDDTEEKPAQDAEAMIFGPAFRVLTKAS